MGFDTPATNFSGTDMEYQEWAFVFGSVAGLIGLEDPKQVAINVVNEGEINMAIMDDDVRLQSKALWYLLVNSCKGKAHLIVKGCERERTSGVAATSTGIPTAGWRPIQQHVDELARAILGRWTTFRLTNRSLGNRHDRLRGKQAKLFQIASRLRL